MANSRSRLIRKDRPFVQRRTAATAIRVRRLAFVSVWLLGVPAAPVQQHCLASANEGNEGPEARREITDPREVQVMVEAMRAGLEQWHREVEFRSTFRFRTGTAEHVTVKDGEVVVDGGSVRRRATGVLHKQGARIRLSIKYDGGMKIVRPPEPSGDGSFSTTQNSQDAVTDGDVTILYTEKMSAAAGEQTVSAGGMARVHKADATGWSLRRIRGSLEMLVTPLDPYAKAIWQPQILDDVAFPQRYSETKARAYEVGDDRLELVLEQSAEDRFSVIELGFWIAPDPPVLTSVKLKDTKAGRGDYEYHATLSHFCECPGGFVASRVVAVSGLQGRPKRFKEWVSEDLGKVPPAHADFVVQVPKDTKIRGIQVLPPIRDGSRTLDIANLGTERLAELPQNVADIVDPSAPPPPEDAGRLSIGTLVVLNVVLLLSVVLLLIWRRRRSSASYR